MSPRELTHIDEHGRAQMVDVTGKPSTRRVAMAACVVRTTADVGWVLGHPPGDIDLLAMAQVAGIQAAKQTSSLVPLCHPIRLDEIRVEVVRIDGGFRVTAVTEITERTGVEMEALTACGFAGLTLAHAVLDVDPRVSVDELTLWHKSGGRSGTWERVGVARG